MNDIIFCMQTEPTYESHNSLSKGSEREMVFFTAVDNLSPP